MRGTNSPAPRWMRSPKKPDGSFTPPVKALIWARDKGCCVLCGKQHVWGSGTYQTHHRRPRGGGGTSLWWVGQAANGIVLCNDHHAHVESHREQSRLTGFLVPLNGRLRADEVPIEHSVHGLVLLTDDGSWTTTITAIASELAVHNGRKEG